MKTHELHWLLPAFGSISHIPDHVHLQPGDRVAAPGVLDQLATSYLIVEEKLDGANCGMALTTDGTACLRNRDHILNKAYPVKKRSAAKQQFIPAWNWIYEHRDQFVALNRMVGETVAVYGEWLLAVHGIIYDQLPDRLVAYAIYVPSTGWLPAAQTRQLLAEASFSLAPLLHEGYLTTGAAGLVQLLDSPSAFSSRELIEGLVVKLPNGDHYKMIRPGYIQNSLWDEKEMAEQPKPKKEGL